MSVLDFILGMLIGVIVAILAVLFIIWHSSKEVENNDKGA